MKERYEREEGFEGNEERLEEEDWMMQRRVHGGKDEESV